MSVPKRHHSDNTYPALQLGYRGWELGHRIPRGMAQVPLSACGGTTGVSHEIMGRRERHPA